MGFKVVKKINDVVEVSDTDTVLNRRTYPVSNIEREWSSYGDWSSRITANPNLNSGRSSVTRADMVDPTYGDTGGFAPEPVLPSAKVVPAPVVVPPEPPQDMGLYIPGDQGQTSSQPTLPPSTPEPPSGPFYDPPPPETQPTATVFDIDTIQNVGQLKELFDQGFIPADMVTAWFNTNKESETLGWTGEVFAVDPGFTSSGGVSTTVAGGNVGTGEGNVPVVNSEGQQVFTAGSYSTVPWSPIYKDFIEDNIGFSGNAAVRKFHYDQGMSNDPLQRTAYTQFLLQATEDDPWRGLTSGGGVVGGLPSNPMFYGGTNDLKPEENIYRNFLDNYKPLEGDNLVSKIKDVINVLKVPEDDWEDYNPGDPDAYLDIQLRNYRWRDRYGSDPRSEQNQQALAALPIMQNTPALLRNETSNILGRIYQRWLTTPNRNPNEGWLEYVDRNNYFGMIGETQQIAHDPAAGGDEG